MKATGLTEKEIFYLSVNTSKKPSIMVATINGDAYGAGGNNLIFINKDIVLLNSILLPMNSNGTSFLIGS